MPSALGKSLLHTSVADAVYKEISSKQGRYYYFLGTTVEWGDETAPPLPVDSEEYERITRNNIIIVKEVQPNDVAFVIDRKNWASNVIYDMYDDRYSTEVVGVDLQAGGIGYSSNVAVTITGGGGAGAAATAYQANGIVTSVVLTSGGTGYTSPPTVVITDPFGANARANAVINYAASGASTLQDSNFYIVTDDFNLYKCIDNNNNSLSTVKPTDTSIDPFQLTDGYIWKFLCSVPVALRNKFLTDTQIPVSTSIRNQFYSGGEIKVVNVTNTGNNYTTARLVVQGDGYLETDPYYIVRGAITIPGKDYTTASLVVADPIPGVAAWVASTVVNIGQKFKYDFNVYDVVRPGTLGTTGPVHTSGIVANGTAGLKYVGHSITGNVSILSGNISGITLDGSIKSVDITNVGSGYLSAPSVSFIGGGGANANAYSIITDGSVSAIQISDIGKNYTTLPTVRIGTAWTPSTVVTLNQQIFNGTYLYTVTGAGTTSTTAPTHTTGVVTNGSASIGFAGNVATGTATLKYGAGYIGAPQANVIGNGTLAKITLEVEKSEAVVSPVIEFGKIVRTKIDNGGIGYTYATITPIGNGTGAEFDVDLSTGDLSSLQSNVENLAVPGAIHAIRVVSGGYGYTGATVTITGDGTGATATAVVLNGRVAKIIVQSPGSGYTRAVITITGTGFGAVGRAVLPPVGGHGRDVVSELFSTSLAFYTTIARDKNQGFDVDNDYRQFGLIKDLQNNNNTRYFNGDVGSAGWVISGSIDTAYFKNDDIIRRVSDNTRYVIVKSTTSGVLVQSIDGGVPLFSDTFKALTNQTFIATGITPPDIDKYSGKLLYIDNRLAFTSTSDQAVSIKTVFKY